MSHIAPQRWLRKRWRRGSLSRSDALSPSDAKRYRPTRERAAIARSLAQNANALQLALTQLEESAEQEPSAARRQPRKGEEVCRLCAKSRKSYYLLLDGEVPICGHCRRKATSAGQETKTLAELPKQVKATKRFQRELQEIVSFGDHVKSLQPTADPKIFFTKITSGGYGKTWKAPPFRHGAVRVFPNYLAQNRAGLYLRKLSPKGMPGVRDAASGPGLLENAHQGSKMYRFELDLSRAPTQEALDDRAAFWTQRAPKRHKFPLGKLREECKRMGQGVSINNCFSYSLFFDFSGKMVRLTYLQSRLFYIMWYVYSSWGSEELVRLSSLLSEGFSLELCGFDVPFEGVVTTDNLTPFYAFPAKPFGHECVLACLLLGASPWEKDLREPVYASLFPPELWRVMRAFVKSAEKKALKP